MSNYKAPEYFVYFRKTINESTANSTASAMLWTLCGSKSTIHLN
jgi:hypothetical protein